MIFEAQFTVFELLNQFMGLGIAIIALVILLYLYTVKRNKQKELTIYKAFVYTSGLSFIYALIHAFALQVILIQYKESEYSTYFDGDGKLLIVAIVTTLVFVLFYKLVSKATERNNIVIFLLGSFSFVSLLINLAIYFYR